MPCSTLHLGNIGAVLMSYDRKNAGSGPLTLGWSGESIELASGDFRVPDTAKAVVVTSAGDVVCRAVSASTDITMTDLPSGYVLPWHCSHIRQSGTTASLATIVG
jgi:hypothetical protein